MRALRVSGICFRSNLFVSHRAKLRQLQQRFSSPRPAGAVASACLEISTDWTDVILAGQLDSVNKAICFVRMLMALLTLHATLVPRQHIKNDDSVEH